MLKKDIINEYNEILLKKLGSPNIDGDWWGYIDFIINTLKLEKEKNLLEGIDIKTTIESPGRKITEFLLSKYASFFNVPIAKLNRSEDDTPYGIYIEYYITVSKKLDILKSLDPVFVHEHHKEIQDFMSSDNKKYNRILKLSKKRMLIC